MTGGAATHDRRCVLCLSGEEQVVLDVATGNHTRATCEIRPCCCAHYCAAECGHDHVVRRACISAGRVISSGG